ncbi:hypothetical protein [Spartinivicinus ruber]|uniref:hypothetical protein n=1 Tax=Spartinivicinus ruber TaxID=2683272 RepID=UPI0013D7117D|nr:hypothetical protein [Spartinivicinus ruber]
MKYRSPDDCQHFSFNDIQKIADSRSIKIDKRLARIKETHGTSPEMEELTDDINLLKKQNDILLRTFILQYQQSIHQAKDIMLCLYRADSF